MISRTFIVAFALLLWPISAGADDQPAYTLSLSWEPAFCEFNRDLPECNGQTVDTAETGRFALHGLWPESPDHVYCDVSPTVRETDKQGDWSKLPKVELPPELKESLSEAMPGTEENQARHEWIKHGTCYDRAEPEAYFSDSVNLLDQINTSPITSLFTNSVGTTLTSEAVSQAFDKAFGRGAGSKVSLHCKNTGGRKLIVEMRINLAGDVSAKNLSNMIRLAQERDDSCESGEIDPVGLGKP
ncbi:ribonuclease [Rhodospirillaceae bacterium KN72]|uniref:Ribonuclease n=1 Tax=Pacificispira spongiicola TaxID=2729598 RepID=A0A7Y0HH71_9PROT|nr:ribonuclease [Pacificispira spongiicola]NMM46403.1 ribonuclease [Pacificispira spongiicola]